MSLRPLQLHLERIYRLDSAPSVEHFLLSQAEVRNYLPDEENPGPQVLVRQQDEEYSFGVFLGKGTVQRIHRKGLAKSNLQDFCSAAEEISHFLYLIWSAKNNRPVSMLDIELQGEIDKFLLASIYFSKEKNLFSRIFEWVTYHEGLTAPYRHRYEKANRLGGKFCRSLGNLKAKRDALTRLRIFYRMNTHERIASVSMLK